MYIRYILAIFYYKLNFLVSFVRLCGIHLFGIAETWLKPSVTDGEISIPNYTLFRKDRRLHGGGVCVYFHKSLAIRRRLDLECETLELLWLELGTGEQSILVGCAYRPPNMRAAYWEDFEENIECACQGRQSSTVLIGDLNVDFGNTQTGSAHPVHRILARFGLQNYVNAPTRVTSHSQSTIALFLSTTPIQGPCEIVYLDISDHYAALARLPCKSSPRRQGETMTKSRRLHRVDWNNFQVDLASTLNSSFNEDSMSQMPLLLLSISMLRSLCAVVRNVVLALGSQMNLSHVFESETGFTVAFGEIVQMIYYVLLTEKQEPKPGALTGG